MNHYFCESKKNLIHYKKYIDEYKNNIKRIEELENSVKSQNVKIKRLQRSNKSHNAYLNNLFIYHTFEESIFFKWFKKCFLSVIIVF